MLLSNHKRVVIFGKNSFIGKNLSLFYKDIWCIFEIDRNLIDDQLIHKLHDFQPDLIINCIAEIYNDDQMFKSNVDILRDIIIKYCCDTKCKLVHLGSSSEYGRKTKPMKEDDILEPTTIYELTKGIGTLMCQTYSALYNFKCVVIRPFTIVGRYEKRHKFFPTLFHNYIFDKPLSLAPGVHDIVFIDDFIDAFDKIINKQDCPTFDIINIGSGVQYSNYQVVETFEQVLNYKYTINHVPLLRPFDSLSWVCDTTKLNVEYGVNIVSDLFNGVSRFISDCKGNNLYYN